MGDCVNEWVRVRVRVREKGYIESGGIRKPLEGFGYLCLRVLVKGPKSNYGEFMTVPHHTFCVNSRESSFRTFLISSIVTTFNLVSVKRCVIVIGRW